MPKKTRCITLLILILTSVLATFLFMQKAKAEVKIISITPASGYVGTNVTLTANITTSDGEYEIWFNGNQLVSGNAVGNSVTTSIIIPPAPSGSHNLTIVDVGSGENNTATFEILTKYLLEISPLELPMQQRQEGDFVEIFVNITGGTSKTLYVANITVQAPNNASHPKLLDLPTSDDGSASATIEYPNTSYVGEYKVFFNGTLATTSFTIGLTNATEYHRFQVVDIKALYAPSENVTLTITKGDYYYSESLTADENGIIYYTNWAVPANATVNDTYTVNITSIDGITTKNPPDIQNFTVPGFDVNITALNLAEEPVPDVTIQIFENETSVVNATSGSDGLASVKLE
ncbi:MAG: hypothetical protein QMD20_02135, partial [Candidatus Bathyarchaeia archaeon]|nr:hypothetical protein [Candidatus Bathyarchaeia archaeon]